MKVAASSSACWGSSGLENRREKVAMTTFPECLLDHSFIWMGRKPTGQIQWSAIHALSKTISYQSLNAFFGFFNSCRNKYLVSFLFIF
jgi:hypothetical protein